MRERMTKSDNSMESLHWFRHSAPYINAHRQKTFIIMIDGEAIEHPNFSTIIHDIALLHSLGIRLVLIHGAEPQINNYIKISNLENNFIDGRRLVKRSTLPSVMSAMGSTRMRIEALLSMGLANSPMFGSRIDVVSGNLVTAKPFGIHNGIDFELSGEVRSIDVIAITKLLDENNIVLISSIGYSTTGEIFSLITEEVATKTAIKIKADKLIFLNKENVLKDASGMLIKEISPAQFDHYNFLNLAPCFEAAKEAALNGVKRVHILPFQQDGALIQELFTRDGIGTMITDAHYENVRMASIEDVGGLMNLLRPLEEQGILVYRSRERLEQEIEQFAVIERDGTILACAALYPIETLKNEVTSSELACVAVHPNYRKSNRAVQILGFLEDKAKQHGIQQLFVLTTRTAHWFLEQGFQVSSVHELPSARQALYNYQRNSQVFKKLL
ncbi:amino-acid N-acetyltransferase [Acinetobacter sp. HY1485]|uniref:amino-acid N-acetyltransferase n=1 Tax=Acinetobacter sp. HY1485 TaxID=2970918 RepID=UPI0022B97775|nr:amino-acid N-acetyltransferase [Acinetobacter sp. HY1485]